MPFSAQTYEAFRDALNQLRPGWKILGDAISGPDGAVVRFDHRHAPFDGGHLDIQFVVNDEVSEKIALWDCVSGIGGTLAEKALFAAHLWTQTTATALLELKYSRRGEFADHYRGHDSGGLPGWHIIHGAIIGFGNPENAELLQRWWLENPVLPAIAETLAPTLTDHGQPHGLKIFFGSDGVAEIRVNGDRHDAASAILMDLPWPRPIPASFVRSYIVALHRETE